MGGKYSIAILLIYFIFRYSLGMPLIVGTQTDNIVESFSVNKFSFHVIKSYGEIFGFSVGPKYLTGFEFVSWLPFNIVLKNTVYICGFFISFFLTAISVYYFFFKLFVKEKLVLLLNIICLLLIFSASITFRLEMRWLVPSFLMYLILLSSFRPFVKRNSDVFNIQLFDSMLFYSFILLSILSNFYYAIFFRRDVYFAGPLHDASILVFLKSLMNI